MPPSPTRRKVVLCIDDNVQGLLVRKIFLETQNYKVEVASSGAEGLRILARSHIDGVILDYRMPHMDGEAVAKAIRRKHPKLPIILLSGYVGELSERVLQLVNTTVPKGAPPSQLLGVLKQLTGEAGRSGSAGQAQTQTSPLSLPQGKTGEKARALLGGMKERSSRKRPNRPPRHERSRTKPVMRKRKRQNGSQR